MSIQLLEVPDRDKLASDDYLTSRPTDGHRRRPAADFSPDDSSKPLNAEPELSNKTTRRKRRRKATHQREQDLRDVINGMGMTAYVGVLTPEGIIVHANDAALGAASLSL